MSLVHVAVNDRGAVVGQDHWRAKLTDHEVELIRMLLAERAALVAGLTAGGIAPGGIARRLKVDGLSYREIALKFEVSKSYVRDLSKDRARAHTVVRTVTRRRTRTDHHA